MKMLSVLKFKRPSVSMMNISRTRANLTNPRNKVSTVMQTLKRMSRTDACFDRSSTVSPFMIDSGSGV